MGSQTTLVIVIVILFSLIGCQEKKLNNPTTPVFIDSSQVKKKDSIVMEEYEEDSIMMTMKEYTVYDRISESTALIVLGVFPKEVNAEKYASTIKHEHKTIDVCSIKIDSLYYVVIPAGNDKAGIRKLYEETKAVYEECWLKKINQW